MNYELFCGDNQQIVPTLATPDMIFADPPDGIGLNYNEYDDRTGHDEYTSRLHKWVEMCVKACPSVWFSFNSRWLLEMAEVVLNLRKQEGLEFTPCVQTFSFYRHNRSFLGNAHRPLWWLRRQWTPVYPEQAKIKSWRQLHGDKRAKAGGKVPGDTFDFTTLPEKHRRDWHERAIEIGGYIVDPLIPDDHFNFTRVVGTSKQRRSYHPTQLNEGLVKRCIQLSTKPGDLVVDPFAGTGTTLRVCKELGDRDCTLVEISKGYCNEIAKEHNLEIQYGQ